MVVLEAQEKQNSNGDELLKIAFLIGWSAGDELHLPRLTEMICLGMGASAASISIAFSDGRQARVYQYPPVASGSGEAAPPIMNGSASFHFKAMLGAGATLNITVDGETIGQEERHVLSQLSALLAEVLGAILIGQRNRHTLGEPFSNLTDREWEVLEALDGPDNESSISQKFQFSKHTVHTYIRHVYRKLRVGTRLEALYRVKQAKAHFRDSVAQKLLHKHRG